VVALFRVVAILARDSMYFYYYLLHLLLQLVYLKRGQTPTLYGVGLILFLWFVPKLTTVDCSTPPLSHMNINLQNCLLKPEEEGKHF